MKKAFTLIEILIAVFVLEIGLLGIATFYSYSFQISKIARHDTIASNLASGLIDEQSAIAFDNLIVGEGTKTRYSDDINNPFYNWYKKIDVAFIDMNLVASYTETETNKNMKKVTITIYWPEGSNERSFQTATIRAKH